MDLRFDGRVAIVTGAGSNPGLGRAYARLLAARGAKVVVNDLGVGGDGRGDHPSDARSVTAEIVADGGEAIADEHSVADEAGARAIVQTAVDAWGRVDVVINNAGVCIPTRFDEVTPADIRTMIDVHVMGSIWMCRSVWPLMREAGYGRIVNTTSGAVFGEPWLTVYGTAKAGIFGLTRGLALEGAPLGIGVNAVSPSAATSAAVNTFEMPEEWLEGFSESLPPDAVAAPVCFLAHESCELSGTMIDVASGHVKAAVFGHTSGFHAEDPTIEGVAANADAIFDITDLELLHAPTDPTAGVRDTGGLMVPKPYQPG
ncbi:MAG TPA: SDR family NAD(P)-dependent oxidoreductase [Acidimicrobiales bacterium]